LGSRRGNLVGPLDTVRRPLQDVIGAGRELRLPAILVAATGQLAIAGVGHDFGRVFQ